ncbi:hypothetical protein FTV88_1823 [Heliorestis convoluta]|uniref:Uncharacterized protein n=1 Tax=Heliorestis convoluta TaxID=356322 RepID=A0A5Q2N0R7_9FIRM|nr:hypothetical protein FTV88_1823 [Heliorestis convoluta]
MGVTISKNFLGLGITLSGAGLGTSAVASLLAVTAWDQSRAEESVMPRPLQAVTPTAAIRKSCFSSNGSARRA